MVAAEGHHSRRNGVRIRRKRLPFRYHPGENPTIPMAIPDPLQPADLAAGMPTAAIPASPHRGHPTWRSACDTSNASSKRPCQIARCHLHRQPVQAQLPILTAMLAPDGVITQRLLGPVTLTRAIEGMGIVFDPEQQLDAEMAGRQLQEMHQRGHWPQSMHRPRQHLVQGMAVAGIAALQPSNHHGALPQSRIHQRERRHRDAPRRAIPGQAHIALPVGASLVDEANHVLDPAFLELGDDQPFPRVDPVANRLRKPAQEFEMLAQQIEPLHPRQAGADIGMLEACAQAGSGGTRNRELWTIDQPEPLAMQLALQAGAQAETEPPGPTRP